MAYKHQIELYVSSLSFVNAFYVLNRTYKVEKIREKLSALCGVCHVSPIDEMTIKRALSLANTDFEDMVQYESAKLVDPDVIVTRNTKHFHGLDIPIKTPIDFLDEQLQ
jgi:acetolactate synthase small subunit